MYTTVPTGTFIINTVMQGLCVTTVVYRTHTHTHTHIHTHTHTKQMYNKDTQMKLS